MIKLNTDRFRRIIFDSYLRLRPKKIKVSPDSSYLGEYKEEGNIIKRPGSTGNLSTQEICLPSYQGIVNELLMLNFLNEVGGRIAVDEVERENLSSQ